jgi:hypothetical protein
MNSPATFFSSGLYCSTFSSQLSALACFFKLRSKPQAEVGATGFEPATLWSQKNRATPCHSEQTQQKAGFRRISANKQRGGLWQNFPCFQPAWQAFGINLVSGDGRPSQYPAT